MFESKNNTVKYLNPQELQKVNGGNSGIVAPEDDGAKKKKNIFIVN